MRDIKEKKRKTEEFKAIKDNETLVRHSTQKEMYY